MKWDSLDTEEKNKAILKMLIYLSKADAHFQDQELGYLSYFCRNTRLDPSLIETYKDTSYDIYHVLPNDEQSRMNILFHLLFTLNADSVVHEDEERTIYKLAFRLGFGENITKDFIQIMKTYPIQKLPNEVMINVIRKYSN